MLAFEGAVRMGYRYLETDVRTTADGVLVVFHDEVLDRLTDRSGRVSDLPWSEVSQARVQGQPIPLVDELLAAWPDVRVNIDAKSDAAVAPLAAAIERARAYDRVCVASFSERRLRTFRGMTDDRVCTSMGQRATARLRITSYGLPTWPFPAGCVQVPVRSRGIPLVDQRLLAFAHRRGVQVHVWTIDDPVEVDRLLDLGVDGIMTDRPTMLREVLQRRDQWSGGPI
jgi:glycerophosphoryl diester phosphodiesterase